MAIRKKKPAEHTLTFLPMNKEKVPPGFLNLSEQSIYNTVQEQLIK